jgi:peptide/nickel transport system permease protein
MSRIGLADSLGRRAEVAAGALLILLVVVVAILVPLVSGPNAATAVHSDLSLTGPGHGTLLGADSLGRSLLQRIAVGYRISLTISVGAVLLATVVGGLLGLLAATSHRIIDGLIMRLLDIVMAFPALLLAIVVVAVFGAGTMTLLFAIAVVYVPIMARVTRAAALQTSQQPFVESAEARGARRIRVIVRHIAPNSVGPVIVQASILVAIGIILEAGLSFVGLGVVPPTPSLGLMLSQGRDFMSTSPWVVAVPAVAILVVVLGFTLLGDGLQSWLDPQKRTIGR